MKLLSLVAAASFFFSSTLWACPEGSNCPGSEPVKKTEKCLGKNGLCPYKKNKTNAASQNGVPEYVSKLEVQQAQIKKRAMRHLSNDAEKLRGYRTLLKQEVERRQLAEKHIAELRQLFAEVSERRP